MFKKIRVYLVLLSVPLVCGGESMSWSAGGEYLSDGDREFLEELEEKYPTCLNLGVGARFLVNGKIYCVNRGDVGLASKVFEKLFTSGMTESIVTPVNNDGEQIERVKPVEIKDIEDEDVFAKILRLAVEPVNEKKFDCFHSQQDENGELTYSLLKGLDQ